ncbi:Found in mitochondrial proteome [Nakaseomyces glabratus]|nr:Found in mitochondrial proteome [Nakaseomyces glabratus]
MYWPLMRRALAKISYRPLVIARPSCRPYSKEVSSKIIIPPAGHFGEELNYAGAVVTKKSNIPMHEYRQLPDDSNYIEKYYAELDVFLQYLQTQLHKSYVDFENDPDELVFQLEKYIELQVRSNYDANKAGEKLVIDRFVAFCEGVKLTLWLNGGHCFIFDVLLQTKREFDKLETTKKKQEIHA